ncbi:MAG: TrmH family RNA methyltransferase, partial [Acidobacteriota bacterium]
VTSRQNAVVKTFRGLAARRPRGESRILLEGEHLVGEALEAGLRITIAALASGILARTEGGLDKVQELAARLQHHGTRVLSVSESVLAAMSPVRTPSGIVAIAEFEPTPLDRVMDGHRPLVAVLVGIQDPGNLGAAVRTAEAAGATGLVACVPSADPFSWKALRGAMGSTFRLPVPERVPLPDALLAARRKGLAIAAAVPRGGTPLHQFNWRRPVAVMLGAEGAGLDERELDHADEQITIPMKPPVESLNVAVSAGVMLYEAARQRATERHEAD